MLEFTEVDAWTEDRLDELGPSEHDFQEFKGARFLADDREISGYFQIEMSKQVSAFSNGAGGLIFVGIDDRGKVDGGVRTDLKGGGTRSWLEDVIGNLVNPKLGRFNIYEVGPRTQGKPSRIRPKHAVYVIEIPESPNAPHQARDHRYYLRIAGKSRPMGHVHVQDVLRRTRNPRVGLARMGPYGRSELDLGDARGPRVFLGFRILLANNGQTLAHHVGAEVILPRPLVGRKVRARILQAEDVHYTQRPGEVAFFRYHPNPVFPGQELFFMMFWVVLHAANIDAVRAGATITWRIYADDAEPVEGENELWRYAAVRRAVDQLMEQLDEAEAKEDTEIPKAVGQT